MIGIDYRQIMVKMDHTHDVSVTNYNGHVYRGGGHFFRKIEPFFHIAPGVFIGFRSFLIRKFPGVLPAFNRTSP